MKNLKKYLKLLLVTNSAFTLIELLVTMVIFVLVLAGASQIFTNLLTQFKQQSKIAETNIEGIIGLEILRRDLEHAGFGLPWNIPSNVTYNEASSSIICGTANASYYNDSPSSPPRAIVSGNNNCTNNSDYLVIKGTNVAVNGASTKWTELIYSSSCSSPYVSFTTNICKRTWSSTGEDLSEDDYVLLISPGAVSGQERLLMANSGSFAAKKFKSSEVDNSWLPTPGDKIRLVYGLSSGTNAPLRPFNRVDYYISTSNVPKRCAQGTGVLVKAMMDYNGGFNQWPILDCVADFQVIYGLDNDNDGDFEPGAPGSMDAYTDNITTLTAQQIRQQVKQVRVYILTHEGQIDRSFSYNTNPVEVGEFGLGDSFNFEDKGINDWRHFRWKIYTIVVDPKNLIS